MTTSTSSDTQDTPTSTSDASIAPIRMFGTTENDTLNGSSGDDSLAGGGGGDELNGGAGNDQLRGDAGADSINGGDGTDVASYSTSDTGIVVDLGSGQTGGGARGDVLSSIENVNGSQHSDFIIGDVSNNVLVGFGGNDILLGSAGDDRLLGGAGDDHLRGDEGSDTINGGEGNDTASYSTSATGVTIDLASGTTAGGAAGDVLVSIENINASDHSDLVFGNASNNELVGYAGDDSLAGGDGDDRLLGGQGNDLLRGDAGADTINGGEGNDTASYSTSATGVTIDLASGATAGGAFGDFLISIENISGSEHDDRIIGDKKANDLFGGSGRDRLAGADGDDRLRGGEGADQLRGGSGADTLAGGEGNDLLTGNSGGDIFVFRIGDGRDRISDFNFGEDIIIIEGLEGDREAAVFSGSERGTQISYSNGDQILLEGVFVSSFEDSILQIV